MNTGVIIWILYFTIGLTMIILPLTEAIITADNCITLINLQAWLYVQAGTQIVLYLVVLPYCLEIYLYNFTENKIQFPRSIFRSSCIATIIFCLFAIAWAGVGIHERNTCPISQTTNIILASSAMSLSFYIIGVLIVILILCLDVCSSY